MGIGVLAAGGSIPEATSGIINARNGKNLTRQIILISMIGTKSYSGPDLRDYMGDERMSPPQNSI